MDDVAGGVVVRVIEDFVVAHLGPDENMSPHVVADPGSHVDLEVVGTEVIIASETVGAIGKIEASGLPANVPIRSSPAFLLKRGW